MKRLAACVLLCLVCLCSRAQTNIYHPFPDSNAVWTEFSSGCCTSNCPGPPFPNPVIYDYNFSYFIEGDTLLNSIQYHKLYQSGWQRSYCYSSGPGLWYPINKVYVGGYRQDTALRKVYWYAYNNAQECLLLDFTLQVGDTVQGCYECTGDLTVTSIDSVLVGGTYRGRWNLSGSQPVSWIEGIGSTLGLLEPLCPFEYGGQLLCFKSGTDLYPDTATNCEILTSMRPSEKLCALSIEPNPFAEYTLIRLNGDLHHATIAMQNILGVEEVMVKDVAGKEVLIKRGDIPSGIYLLRITENRKLIAVKKVIVE